MSGGEDKGDAMDARKSRRPRAAARKDRSGERPLDWPGDPELLTAEAVDFEALACVLANTCRRGGRLRRFHSLAAHAVLLSEAIENLGESGAGDGRIVALHALLADASVAWLGAGAVASQRGAERFKRLRETVDRAVREAAGLRGEPSPEQSELLRFVARMGEAAENRDLPGAGDGAAPAIAFPPLPSRIRAVEPGRAARLWLDRLRNLRGGSELERSVTAPSPGESRNGSDSASRDEPQPTGVHGLRTAGGSGDEA